MIILSILIEQRFGGTDGALSYVGLWIVLLGVLRIQPWRGTRFVCAAIWLEELLVLLVMRPNTKPYNETPAGGLVAAAAAGILLLPVRLPDGALPLRGLWLRRMLAGLAISGLVIAAWPPIASNVPRCPPAPVLVFLGVFVLWSLKPLFDVLVREDRITTPAGASARTPG